MRHSGLVAQFVRDLQYGTRALQRNPGIATVAVLTLALGIGANTAGSYGEVSNSIGRTKRPAPMAASGRMVIDDRGAQRD